MTTRRTAWYCPGCRHEVSPWREAAERLAVENAVLRDALDRIATLAAQHGDVPPLTECERIAREARLGKADPEAILDLEAIKEEKR